MSAVMHTEAVGEATKNCAMCRQPFTPRASWGSFCSSKCRNEFSVEFGVYGQVMGVRKIKNGVSVVIHLPVGPAAEHGLKLLLRQFVRVVKTP